MIETLVYILGGNYRLRAGVGNLITVDDDKNQLQQIVGSNDARQRAPLGEKPGGETREEKRTLVVAQKV